MFSYVLRNYKNLLFTSLNGVDGQSAGEQAEPTSYEDIVKQNERLIGEMKDTLDSEDLSSLQELRDSHEQDISHLKEVSKQKIEGMRKIIEQGFEDTLSNGMQINNDVDYRSFMTALSIIAPEFDTENLKYDDIKRYAQSDDISLSFTGKEIRLFRAVGDEGNAGDEPFAVFDSSGNGKKVLFRLPNLKSDDNKFSSEDILASIDELKNLEKNEAAAQSSLKKKEKITALTEKLQKGTSIDSRVDFDNFSAAVQAIDSNFVDISNRYEDVRRELLNKVGKKEFSVSYQLGEVRIFEPITNADAASGLSTHTFSISSQGTLKRDSSLDKDFTGNNEKIESQEDNLSDSELIGTEEKPEKVAETQTSAVPLTEVRETPLLSQKVISNTRYYFSENVPDDKKALLLTSLGMGDLEMNLDDDVYIAQLYYSIKELQGKLGFKKPDGYFGKTTLSVWEGSYEEPVEQEAVEEIVEQEVEEIVEQETEANEGTYDKNLASSTLEGFLSNFEDSSYLNSSLTLNNGIKITAENFQLEINIPGEEGTIVIPYESVVSALLGSAENSIFGIVSGLSKEVIEQPNEEHNKIQEETETLVVSSEIPDTTDEETPGVSEPIPVQLKDNLEVSMMVVPEGIERNSDSDKQISYYKENFENFVTLENKKMIQEVLGYTGEVDLQDENHLLYIAQLVGIFQGAGGDKLLGKYTLGKIVDTYLSKEKQQNLDSVLDYENTVVLDMKPEWGIEQPSETFGPEKVEWVFNSSQELIKVATGSYEGPVFNSDGKQVIFRLADAIDNQKNLPNEGVEKKYLAFHKSGTAHDSRNPDISDINMGFDNLGKYHMSVGRNGNMIQYTDMNTGNGGLGPVSTDNYDASFNQSSFAVEFSARASSPKGKLKIGLDGQKYTEVDNLHQDQIVAGRRIAEQLGLTTITSIDPLINENGDVVKSYTNAQGREIPTHSDFLKNDVMVKGFGAEPIQERLNILARDFGKEQRDVSWMTNGSLFGDIVIAQND